MCLLSNFTFRCTSLVLKKALLCANISIGKDKKWGATTWGVAKTKIWKATKTQKWNGWATSLYEGTKKQSLHGGYERCVNLSLILYRNR